MTIKEMHIELEQGLQKIAAYRTRKYLPQEFDMVLNKVVERFIQTKIKPEGHGGFSLNQLELDAIRPLLVKASIPAYIESTNKYKVFLPADYAYLIADTSQVSKYCGTQQKSLGSTTLNYYKVKLGESLKSTPPYYQQIEFRVNSAGINITEATAIIQEGFKNRKDIQLLVDWICAKMNEIGRQQSTPFSVAWMRYGDIEIYQDNYEFGTSCFVITVPNTSTASIVLKYDGSNALLSSTVSKTYQFHNPVGTQYMHSNRLQSSEIIEQMMGVAYYKTRANSPISEIVGNKLFIYADDSFTVNRCLVTYVRKPRPVSLALESDCELAPEFHRTICNLAVEYIKGTLNDVQGVELAERDLTKRVRL